MLLLTCTTGSLALVWVILTKERQVIVFDWFVRNKRRTGVVLEGLDATQLITCNRKRLMLRQFISTDAVRGGGSLSSWVVLWWEVEKTNNEELLIFLNSFTKIWNLRILPLVVVVFILFGCHDDDDEAS